MTAEEMPQDVKAIKDWIVQNKPFMLDVRSAGEVASNNIPGVLNISIQELNSGSVAKAKEAANGRPLGIYCASGGRSRMAVELFNQQKYPCFNCHTVDTMKYVFRVSPEAKQAAGVV
eukprot:CAMPEP_0204270046 /NCGR_PEP_ID=MMETSP0468-20130131/18034_1 /ASSEMBLY_ACC=CAM_ASM_000383 /TAXON_ID=2969 /ORGANISM="Oxyrrhis marina" /LENGTH=116 /DNA_ID=CAMNT_0051245533 /DNA_START=51 /DNA_END=401 /DNA_ORIENTATION=+